MELNKEILIGLGFEADKNKWGKEIFRLEWLPFNLEHITNDCYLDDTPIEPYFGLGYGNALFSHPKLRTVNELKDLCKMFGAFLR